MTLKCTWCGRRVRLRNDGQLARHTYTWLTAFTRLPKPEVCQGGARAVEGKNAQRTL
jgi:hypothetical protein